MCIYIYILYTKRIHICILYIYIQYYPAIKCYVFAILFLCISDLWKATCWA